MQQSMQQTMSSLLLLSIYHLLNFRLLFFLHLFRFIVTQDVRHLEAWFKWSVWVMQGGDLWSSDRHMPNLLQGSEGGSLVAEIFLILPSLLFERNRQVAAWDSG